MVLTLHGKWGSLIRRSVRGCAVALLILLVAEGTAEAGNYTLTYGKQFEVCRAFAENLASFGDLPQGLFEWPINPKFKKFRKPEWKPLDPKQHLARIENWVRARLPGGQPPDSVLGDEHWENRLGPLSLSQQGLQHPFEPGSS